MSVFTDLAWRLYRRRGQLSADVLHALLDETWSVLHISAYTGAAGVTAAPLVAGAAILPHTATSLHSGQRISAGRTQGNVDSEAWQASVQAQAQFVSARKGASVGGAGHATHIRTQGGPGVHGAANRCSSSGRAPRDCP